MDRRPLKLPGRIAQAVFPDGVSMAGALADCVAMLLRDALARRGAASLVVSGGRSPIPFLRALGERELDWSRVVVTLADERWVPPGHPDSNEGMVRASLLDGRAATSCFVPIYGGEDSADAGVDACAARIAGVPRPFDVVVLGMGEDGHFASLFPGAANLATLLGDDAPAAAAVHPPHAKHARMTLSLPALLDARQLLLPLQGPAKRAAIEEAAAQGDPMTRPVAALLKQIRVPLQVFFCPAA